MPSARRRDCPPAPCKFRSPGPFGPASGFPTTSSDLASQVGSQSLALGLAAAEKSLSTPRTPGYASEVGRTGLYSYATRSELLLLLAESGLRVLAIRCSSAPDRGL